ncbi:zinc-dependent alcohol dehydrogenase [Pedobacter heparinus]|uniref:zinc-dependent alcohol dehydrogenase n=1 Tax=Pedobacter heparinus TaxID=984 RepID=UPI002931AB82|nr:alcohol dehydrogenase catalytic domain-containing protein [Pedobacter heparinus]
MKLPTMKALQLQGLNQLVPVILPLPVPKANEVLIRTAVTTICTSDLHDIRNNPFAIKLPSVLGHEGAGTIVQCGQDVRQFSIGMRVAAHPVVPCGVCVECQRGFGHLCLNMGHLGIDRAGTFSEYFVQRADRVRELPDGISFSLGALLEPVANCLQAISRAGDIKGKVVFVVGDGPFGNIIARLAQRAGAARVLVAGKEPFRLGIIPGVEIVNTHPVASVDVAILAVSSADAFFTCMAALRKRGRLVVFSLLKEPVPVDLFNLHISELEIVGCCNDEDKIDESLACLQDPALKLSDLVTHEIPFENWEQAFYLARDRHDKALKVALIF